MRLPGASSEGEDCARAQPGPSPIVGKIRSLGGAVWLIRADGTPLPVETGCLLCQGDVIETGADGRIGITFADGTEFNLSADARITLGEFENDPQADSPAQVKVARGKFAFARGKDVTRDGFSIDTPLGSIRGDARSCAVATLTLVGFTIALLGKLEAFPNDPYLLDELIKYKDLQHGTLFIIPNGGKLIVLDDPEMTVIIGPPGSGLVQLVTNSTADMAMLLGLSDEGNRAYQLGLADPFTTGSTDRAETHLFFPDGPGTTLVAGGPTDLLPPLGNDPPPNQIPDGGGGSGPPPDILVLTLNENLIVDHDHSSGVQVDPDGEIDDTDDPFPIDLGDLDGFHPDLIIGQASDGAGPGDDPFVSTAGSTGPVLITVEPSFDGVYSGLDVTGGGQIFLYKEFTDGQQVVVGREGGADGPIAFIVFVTPDGEALWVQELLPIHHTDPTDSPTNIPSDPDSVVSVLDDVLLVRGTLIGTSLTQTAPIGNHIEFVDDAPEVVVAADASAADLAALDVALDESVGNDPDGENLLNGPDDDNPLNTVPVNEIDPLGSQAIGSQDTDPGELAALFTETTPADFGTDEAGSRTDVFALFLAGTTNLTNLYATQTGAPELAGLTGEELRISLFVVSDTVIEGRISGDGADGDEFVAFRITLADAADPANAHIVVEQFMAIDHGADTPSLLDEGIALLMAEGGSLGLTLTTTLIDGDDDQVVSSASVTLIGDSLNGGAGSFITFEDDGPTIDVVAVDEASVLLTTQDAETDGDPTDEDANASAADFSGVFSIDSQSFGTDGAGIAPTLAYALSLLVAGGTTSGLFSDEAAINLYDIGGVITGSTAAAVGDVDASNTIFTLSVSADGTVTQTQFAEIDHGAPGEGAPPYDDQLAVLSDGLVKLTASATISDADTDTASDSEFIDLGGNIQFADDGPSIDVAAGNEASVLLTTQDAETDGDPTDEDADASAADFSGVFSIASQSFGADGAGIAPTLGYALSLAVAEGTASGLFSNDAAINLYEIGGAIIASTAATEDAVDAANTIFTLSVGADGTVTQTQFAEIDHAAPGEGAPPYDDQLAVLSDGLVKLTASATITDSDTDTASDSEFIDLGGNIQFADDGPTAPPVTENLVETTGADTNVLLIFDVSGSMDDPSGLTNLTRLDLAKAAANELLEQYENQGDVRVQIITFSDTAAKQGGVWLQLDAAKAFIAGLSANGASDYNDATALGPDAFDDAGKLATAGVRNVSYFISDNSPTSGDALSGGDITNWTTFLNNNEILSIALGVGTVIGTTALNPVAYDGRGTGTDTNATLVTDPSQAPVVPNPSTIPPESGTLVPPGSFGADGGFVKSITIDGVTTYTYDPLGNGGNGSITSSGTFAFDTASNTLTVTLASLATFAIDMDDGSYTYTAPPSVNSNLTEQIAFTLSDGDLDTASNTLTINVADASQPPMARDDLVITSINGDGASIVIPDFALLYNDTDPNGQTVAVKSVSAPSSGTVTDNVGSVTFTDGASSDNGGSFTYTGESQPPVAGTGDEDTARVTVDREQENDSTLQGTGLGEILIGRNNAADTISGFGGNDVLIGGNGALTTTTPQVVFTIIADGSADSANSDFLRFDFIGGLAGMDFVQSITIDLNAGPENDAVFDPSGGNADGRGPTFSAFNGAGFNSADVNVEPDPGDNTAGTLSLVFGAGSFTVGSNFDLDIDIDSLGSDGGGSDANSGEEFEDSGVQATIVLQDGRTQTLTFGDASDDDDDSQVTFTFPGQVVPAIDDTLDGGAGDDLLWGQGGNDVLIGGAGADKYLFQPGEGGVDEISLFEAADEILVDVASLSLTALTATGIAAGDFASGDVTSAGFNGTGREFFFETDANTLWYSATGAEADKIALATISSGVDPNASDIKIF